MYRSKDKDINYKALNLNRVECFFILPTFCQQSVSFIKIHIDTVKYSNNTTSE